MPLLVTPDYRCPLLLRGEHLETIAPNVSRRRFVVPYARHRLELADGDFVDLDTLRKSGSGTADTCVLALHGLEGSSTAPYIKSFAKVVGGTDWDFVAMTMRGCSDEMNRAVRFYHSGESGDLRSVVEYLESKYKAIYIIGFSLGGNVVLKYVGEDPNRVSSRVRAVVAVSAPVDLEGSALRIGEKSNRFYMRRFIRLLSSKVEAKARMYPDGIDAVGCRELRDFEAFDGRYTAPLNGYASAEDYWRRCSALNWLADIRCPALLINARNDPFLSAACFPEEIARASLAFHAAFPERGGHVGFPSWRRGGRSWHEGVALGFFERFSLGGPAF